MNRKDLRTAEQEFRQTKNNRNNQYKFEVPPKRVKVLTVLKIVGIVILLAVLADNHKECQSLFGTNSKYCVD